MDLSKGLSDCRCGYSAEKLQVIKWKHYDFKAIGYFCPNCGLRIAGYTSGLSDILCYSILNEEWNIMVKEKERAWYRGFDYNYDENMKKAIILLSGSQDDINAAINTRIKRWEVYNV